MNITAPVYIKSTPSLAETYFEDVIIFIKEYNSNGAVGVIVNKPFGRTLNHLQEFSNSISLPIFTGGPVDTEHLFFLHQRADIIDGSQKIADGIYWGGNFGQAVTGLNSGTILPDEIKIFNGYCGWDAGELEAEILEGSWEVIASAALF